MRAATAILRSALFAAVFYGGSVGFVLMGLACSMVSDRMFAAVVRGWSRFHHDCAAVLLGVRIRVEGAMPDHPCIFAARHESFFEAFDLPRLLGRPAIIAKRELMGIPMWGRLAMAYGVVPVDREAGAKTLREMMAAARGFVKEGRSLMIFPEGTRVPHGARAELRAGFAGLYKLMRLPVVPIAHDSGRFVTRAGLLRRSGTVTIRFGEPIPPGLEREEVEALVLEAINALNEPARVEDQSSAS